MQEIVRRLLMVAVAATVPCMMAMAADARVALVIGNAEYEHAPVLNNPVNDASDVMAALERLGFAVTLLKNGDQTSLRRGLQQFARAASVAQFAVVYYAGHGIEVDRRNFLVPVDARLASDADTEFETVPLDLVIRSVSRASFRLVILDACRENPFARKMQTAGTTRSIGRGLTLIEPPGGTLVAYAAKDGTLAEDGEGRNSPYAQALLRFLEQPNLEVGMMFRHVRDDVLAATGGRQEPFTYGSLPKEGIYFQSSQSDPTTAEPLAPSAATAQASSDSSMPEPQRALIVDELDEFRWTTQAVDVHADPSDASTVLLSLEPLVEVNVIGAVRDAPWLRVAPDDGGTGYVAAAALSDLYPVVDAEGVYRVVRRANVRSGPGVTYDAVSRLDAGTDVRVTGQFLNTDWLRVATESGEGYVKATALSDQFPVEAASGTYRATRRTEVTSGSGIGWKTVARLEPGDEVEVTGRLQVMGEDWLRVAVGSGRVGYVAAVGLLDVAADDGAYARARRADTSAAYGEYLRRYPSGRNVEEARRFQAEARDDEAFARAKTSGTSAAYGSYLRTYPTGRHAAEARRLQRQAEEEQRLRPGSRFRDCAGCPEMVVVPAGSFMMGSPASEEARDDNEGPRHRVTIAKPIAVGVYEVTFAEWDTCVRGGGCRYRPDDEGWGRGQRPVINVSWEDAQQYVRWLSRQSRAKYRLLSEAEWEYVARAGTTTPFHYGRTISTNQANYNGKFTFGGGRKGTYRGRTAPGGTFAPNAFGLYDVHDNVREWTHDCWNGSYRGAPADGSAWETGDCSRRVLRGGSWSSGPRVLRSANRSGIDSGYRFNNFGFRVARTLTS